MGIEIVRKVDPLKVSRSSSIFQASKIWFPVDWQVAMTLLNLSWRKTWSWITGHCRVTDQEKSGN